MAVLMQNGNHTEKFIDTIDLDDPEYAKELLRPPEVKEDIRLMGQRRRVSLVLKSSAFRKEIEKITASHMSSGELSQNVLSLQNLVDYVTPHAKLGTSAFNKCATMPVIPVNDIKSDSSYSKAEKLMRCKLASVYRLIDLFQWNSSNNVHTTAKINRTEDQYLINPRSLLYNELTASSLVKVDINGGILEPGSVGSGIDNAGWMLHAAVHKAKDNMRCVVHISTPATIVVSSLEEGLMPLSQEAMIIGEVAKYKPSNESNPRTIEEEFQAISDAINAASTNCRVLLVDGFGLIAYGESIEEAWFNAYTSVLACEAQLRLSCVDKEEIVLPSNNAQKVALEVGRTPSRVQMGATAGGGWRPGELEFEAFMRQLDGAGYRTGHLYRLNQIKEPSGFSRHVGDGSGTPSVRRGTSLTKSFRGKREGIELPPSTSSFSTSFYGDRQNQKSLIKAKTMSLQRTHWLNTPNAYKRSQKSEIGTANPKTITTWKTDQVQEDSLDNAFDRFRKAGTLPTKEIPVTPAAAKAHTLTSGVSMSVEDPNTFAPQGQNPKELKLNQMKIKDKYYKNIKTAGPKSKVLDGLDYDDLYDDDGMSSPGSGPASPSGTLLRLDPTSPPQLEPGHVVLVGAVSKGIIKENVRHNVAAFQSVYSPNPFDHVTNEELNRYTTNVDRKAKGMLTLEEEEAREAVRRQLEAEKLAEQQKKEAEMARLNKAKMDEETSKRQSRKNNETPKKTFKEKMKSAVRSDTSGADEATEETDGESRRPKDKQKKKRRFKFLSFARGGNDDKQ